MRLLHPVSDKTQITNTVIERIGVRRNRVIGIIRKRSSGLRASLPFNVIVMFLGFRALNNGYIPKVRHNPFFKTALQKLHGQFPDDSFVPFP